MRGRSLLWLEKQKGIDKDRIALVGHSEGGLVAMLTAGRERGKVAAMALVGTPSTSGNEVVLEQQKHMLSKMPIDDAQRAEKIALQEKINTAVIKGTGWGDIPVAARRAADTPWFYSFLTFNPEKAMDDTRQPVVIVQGELDMQVMPHHADKLGVMARERKGDKVPIEVVKVPGVNHLLVPAKTGDVSEYGSLGPDAKVSPQVTSAIAQLPDESPEGLSSRLRRGFGGAGRRAAHPHHRPRPAGVDVRADVDPRALRRARARHRPGGHSRRRSRSASSSRCPRSCGRRRC